MRCPSCGTENAPDSRFCGGCGARLEVTAARVAPTHKISDDAVYPQFSSNAPPSTLPPANGPSTLPPANLHVPMPMPRGPSSVPPGIASGRAATEPADARRKTPVPVPRPAPLPAPSSVALPHQGGRRWGLVIAILVVDLGLAATGVVLLMQGLRDDRPAAAQGKSSAVVEPATGSAPVVTATGSGSAAAPAQPAPLVTPLPDAKPLIKVEKAVVKARPGPPAAKPPVVAGKPAKLPKQPPRGAPVDPYETLPPSVAGAKVVDDEDHSAAISEAIEVKSNRAEGVFGACYTRATKPLPADQPLRGRIQIAFTVMTNGRVDRVTTAENQTGSDQLANCLASEIGSWSFADHPQDPIEITKIFAFGPSSS